MFLQSLTVVHVIISLVAIVSGFAVVFAWLGGRSPGVPTALFLWTTVATSATGFLFPFKGITPAFTFGILSMIALPVSFHALYRRGLAGGWRKAYLLTALFALYLNTFALMVQLFLKVPVLKAIAPAQTDPPFAIAQVLLLALFIALGIASVRRFPARPALG